MNRFAWPGLALVVMVLTTGPRAVWAGTDDTPRVSTFFNVVAPTGADPWIFRHSDGWYYATFTTGVDVTLVRSHTISALGAADRKVVYVPPAGAKNLWAPELHWVDERWYVYFAADNGDNANHRMFVLENASADPFQGHFVLKGKIADPRADRWAIDGTLLRINDRKYFVWSGWEGSKNEAQDLYIAPVATPWKLAGPRVRISRPTLPWETLGGPPSINEGPEVLQRGGRVFLVYSAAGSWTDHYALGLLALKPGTDPLVPTSWTKHPSPVFAAGNGVFGPGHCSFVKSPDGREDWIVYHAAKQQGAGWSRLLRAQAFTWNNDGTPHFGEPSPADRPIALPGGEPPRIRVEAETAACTGTARIAPHPSASGGEKVGHIDTPDSSATLTVNVPSAGRYTLVVRSCNGTSDKALATHRLTVNGGETHTLRYENAGWDVWSNVFLNIELNAGENRLRFAQGEHFAEIDCVDLIPSRFTL